MLCPLAQKMGFDPFNTGKILKFNLFLNYKKKLNVIFNTISVLKPQIVIVNGCALINLKDMEETSV